MKKLLAGAAVLASAFVLSGCYVAPVKPAIGSIYASVGAPLDIDAKETPVSSRSGSASSACVLGLVSWGDCSTTAAAQDGGLTRVDHMDYEFFHVLGIYQRFTTVAYGE